MSVLENIYNGDYTPGKAAEKLPFSLRLAERAFFEAIEGSMGEDFIERHWDGLCKAERFRDCANFRDAAMRWCAWSTHLRKKDCA